MTTSLDVRRTRNAAAQRRSREKNKEKLRAVRLARYAGNPEKFRAENAAYRAANPEKIIAYRVANKAHQDIYGAAWYATHRVSINAQRRAKYAANPRKYENFTARNNLRRARKLAASGSHTAMDIKTLFSLQRGKCAVCREGIKGCFQVDHILPLKLGGSNGKENLQILCPQCNKSKYTKHPIDFMQTRGFLL